MAPAAVAATPGGEALPSLHSRPVLPSIGSSYLAVTVDATGGSRVYLSRAMFVQHMVLAGLPFFERARADAVVAPGR